MAEMSETSKDYEVDLSDSTHKNEILEIIGRDVFEYEISKYLQPYERFLLSATCRFMGAIFNISNFDFDLHSKSDLTVLKSAIIDKFFRKKKTYRHSTNCIDLSNKIYSTLTRHERLCIKYVLIFQQKLPEYFPTNSFQNFLDIALKLTFSSNDADHADSIISFLYDIIVHKTSNISELIHNLHLDNIGLNSSNHLNILSNKILIYTQNIRYLYLADNPLINDECIQDLFLCIAANNHYLEILDLSNTSITNKTCFIIYDFCESVYKINNGIKSNYSSDNDESNYLINNDKESQSSQSHDNFQEIIYMSSEEEDDEQSDLELTTDDEFDLIVETKIKTMNQTIVSTQNDLQNYDNDDNDDDNDDDDDEAALESIDENKNDEIQDNKDNSDHILVPENLMKISLSLKWIDLKNNKGITNDGVDKLNQIYVKKMEPVSNFVLCVEGCNYEPNPNWDLSLL